MVTDGNPASDIARVYKTQRKVVRVVPHILVVEDQPTIRELLSWTLQLAGYHDTASVGRQVLLSPCEEGLLPADVPAVLLLDLSLLCTSEVVDFLCHLRAQWRIAGRLQPQIIVLTTNARVRAELRSREHILQKPFHVRDLITLIQQAALAAYRSEDGPF